MVVAALYAIGIGLALLLIGEPLVGPLVLLTFLEGFVPIVVPRSGRRGSGAVALVASS
jgi:predicted cation transporter